jgi:hypothetical protein
MSKEALKKYYDLSKFINLQQKTYKHVKHHGRGSDIIVSKPNEN